MLTCKASLNASSLGFVLCVSTLKDLVMSTLWPYATRCFAIQKVGDCPSVYGGIVDRDNHFGVCSDTRWGKQRSVSTMWASYAKANDLIDNVRHWDQQTRQLEWFSKLNFSVACRSCNCAAVWCSRLMTDLRFLLLWLNKWSPLNGKAMKTCHQLVEQLVQWMAELTTIKNSQVSGMIESIRFDQWRFTDIFVLLHDFTRYLGTT